MLVMGISTRDSGRGPVNGCGNERRTRKKGSLPEDVKIMIHRGYYVLVRVIRAGILLGFKSKEVTVPFVRKGLEFLKGNFVEIFLLKKKKRKCSNSIKISPFKTTRFTSSIFIVSL